MEIERQEDAMYKELLEKYGSPLYVYDEKILEDNCRNMTLFQENLKSKLKEGTSVSMHYSTKANSNLAILNVIKEARFKC